VAASDGSSIRTVEKSAGPRCRCRAPGGTAFSSDVMACARICSSACRRMQDVLVGMLVDVSACQSARQGRQGGFGGRLPHRRRRHCCWHPRGCVWQRDVPTPTEKGRKS